MLSIIDRDDFRFEVCVVDMQKCHHCVVGKALRMHFGVCEGLVELIPTESDSSLLSTIDIDLLHNQKGYQLINITVILIMY